MAETVKVPGLGPTKKVYVYAGVGVAGGIVVYAYWRAANAPAAEEEVLAEEEMGTDVPAEMGYDYALGPTYDYGGAAGVPSYQGPTYTGTIGTGSPTTNAEWAQEAREQLATEGADTQAASSAIGNYLAKLCLSTTQADLIRRALAMLGSPPQGSHSIVICSPGGGTGDPPPAATAPGAPTGVRVARTFRTEIQIDWSPVQGAKGYAVYRSEPAPALSTWQRQTTSVYDSYQFKGLRPNTTYRFRIVSIGLDNRPGGEAVISAKTSK